MFDSDINSLYERDKQPGVHMYCFIHVDISGSLHKASIQSVSFETLDVLRMELLKFFDTNNANILVDLFIQEDYHKDTESQYVLCAISNNNYNEGCTWIKADF